MVCIKFLWALGGDDDEQVATAAAAECRLQWLRLNTVLTVLSIAAHTRAI
jgi:hypothetical protein